MANETRETVDETDVSTDETAGRTPRSGMEAGQPDKGRQEPGSVQDADPTVDAAGETAEGTGADPGEAPRTAGLTGESAGQADGSGAAADAEAGGSRSRLAAVVLGAAVVVLAAFGVWATLAAHSLRATAAPPNIAVTNGAATSAVNRQIVSAVNTVFSYNYANTGATRRAAQGLLTGAAIRQYNTYFALVTKDAPAQKLVVTTRVTNSGVELLSGNRARVLVFANQQDTRAGTTQSSYAGALFAVTAVRQGGRWKIDNIDTFNGQG